VVLPVDPPNLATVQFASTTIYHWPMFADNATSLPKNPIVVTGPFQFGDAVELDKTQSQVGLLTILNRPIIAKCIAA